MLNRSARLAMSTNILKALPVKLDTKRHSPTVMPTKSDSDIMFCLQSYHGLIIDRSLCINPILQIGLIDIDLLICISSSRVYMSMFYLQL